MNPHSPHQETGLTSILLSTQSIVPFMLDDKQLVFLVGFSREKEPVVVSPSQICKYSTKCPLTKLYYGVIDMNRLTSYKGNDALARRHVNAALATILK